MINRMRVVVKDDLRVSDQVVQVGEKVEEEGQGWGKDAGWPRAV